MCEVDVTDSVVPTFGLLVELELVEVETHPTIKTDASIANNRMFPSVTI